MGEQTDAAKRAAARKAKILARGNSGLNRLAQTARGEEAEKLYGHGETSRPPTPSVKVESEAEPSKPSWAPPPPASASNGSRAQSNEQQQMQEQLNRMMSMFGGPSAGAGAGGEGGVPDMSQLLAQMMGGAAPGNGMAGDRLLGDLDDPAGLPNQPNFPDLASMMGGGGAGGGGSPFGGMPGMGMPGMGTGMGMGMGMGGPVKRSWIVRIFPLIHALAMILLVGFTIIWWEPRIGSRRYGLVERSWADRFGDFRGSKRFGDDFRISALTRGVEVVPFFWAFTTLELIIQTTRFLLLKSPPPPHSLLQTFLPIMPPNLARPLITASRYFSLLSQTIKDGFLLIFLLGLVVILADYLS